ncbi:MAG: class I SAM-dependent methyltransferase [Solirubrobacteraceae bacterium]
MPTRFRVSRTLIPAFASETPARSRSNAYELRKSGIASRAGATGDRAWRVLDLGCGDGRSVDAFRARDAEVQWTGLDVADSAEVRQRTRTDATFVSFDGERIPFEDGSFDLIFCKQVLEHVRRPEPLLAEVSRCLTRHGRFAGSTSQLEPYHSQSTQNITPYGLSLMLGRAGLELIELRPGIDVATMLAFRALGSPRCFHRWWAHESPGNVALELAGRVRRLDARARNALKLLFCAQYSFLAERGE